MKPDFHIGEIIAAKYWLVTPDAKLVSPYQTQVWPDNGFMCGEVHSWAKGGGVYAMASIDSVMAFFERSKEARDFFSWRCKSGEYPHLALGHVRMWGTVFEHVGLDGIIYRAQNARVHSIKCLLLKEEKFFALTYGEILFKLRDRYKVWKVAI